MEFYNEIIGLDDGEKIKIQLELDGYSKNPRFACLDRLFSPQRDRHSSLLPQLSQSGKW